MHYSPEFIIWVVRLLTRDPRIDIIGYTFSDEDALDQVTRLRPHLVVLISALPDMDSLEVAHQIKVQPSAPCVIMLTRANGPECDAAAEAAHVDGCINKSEYEAKLLPLIHTLFGEPDTSSLGR